ncbi:DUF3429 family protein [bacterium]|nr:DUF3429 family protein [bacterium]
MSHLILIYMGCLPFVLLCLAHYAAVIHPVVIQKIIFYYSYSILNFVCGYHWTLSLTVITHQAKNLSVLFSLSSVMIAMLFGSSQESIASVLLAFLIIGQYVIDIKSDIAHSIPVLYKVARLVATLTIVLSLIFSMMLSS